MSIMLLGSFELNRVYQHDCIEALKQLPDNSIDSIVTDPPYELGFMGKSWDSTGIAYNIELWQECLRVLKPGGHLLAFGGTRTYHRMACAIEDAGFEIRDQLQWIYGSGFPKSTDISKQIDKLHGAEREIVAPPPYKRGKATQAYSDRRKVGYDYQPHPITASATSDAKQWDGWGTGLKPAHEPIVMARKPYSEKTIAKNVLKWGTGGINIDDSRIPTDWENEYPPSWFNSGKGKTITWNGDNYTTESTVSDRINQKGRFPANVMFDENAAEILDNQSGVLKSGSNCVRRKEGSFLEHSGLGKAGDVQVTYGDSGGASRFFYCAKAAKKEKGKFNNHPTVKPIKLMEYLVTLVTPKEGIVLDPFVGSGSTLVACKNKNFKYIGFEKESQYIEITNKRLESDFDRETDGKVLNT